MANMLDLDQLRTFVAIADSGSFTKAADSVHKTQSAVSMQMRRLEERIGKPIFGRDGRSAKLTEDGERLLGYARRLIRLSDETVAAFDDDELSGRVRLGTPDDYADRFLPEILARFSRSNPKVEVTVVCEPTVQLVDCIRNGSLDLAIVTNHELTPTAEVVRQEPLLWVVSNHHRIEEEDVLPLALGRDTCCWRKSAQEALNGTGRRFRLLYASNNSTALAAAVLAGLAISVFPESALRPGMRVLGEAEGFPRLAPCQIALLRAANRPSTATIDALAEHIISSLDNLSMRIAAE